MPKKKSEIIVSFILDKSGSMGGLQQYVISGFNEYLATLKKKKAQVNFSLTLFDTESIDKVCVNVPLAKVHDLTKETYIPNAMTPLYDAVVDTIEALFEEVKTLKTKPSVIVVIMTDGQENSSTRHNERCMRELIEKLQKEHAWTFVYMGANQDSYATAANYGILRGNTVNWGATPKGSKSAFGTFAMASVNYVDTQSALRASGVGGQSVKSFFSEEMKEEVEKEAKK